MIIHNATFMVERQMGAEFLDWFAPLAHKAAPVGRAHLSVLREAGNINKKGGEEKLHPVGTDGEPLSVAFQVEFESVEDMDKWIGSRFRPLAAAFERRYVNAGMIFTSVSERIF
mgnify:CR=1 FL=1